MPKRNSGNPPYPILKVDVLVLIRVPDGTSAADKKLLQEALDERENDLEGDHEDEAETIYEAVNDQLKSAEAGINRSFVGDYSISRTFSVKEKTER